MRQLVGWRAPPQAAAPPQADSPAHAPPWLGVRFFVSRIGAQPRLRLTARRTLGGVRVFFRIGAQNASEKSLGVLYHYYYYCMLLLLLLLLRLRLRLVLQLLLLPLRFRAASLLSLLNRCTAYPQKHPAPGRSCSSTSKHNSSNGEYKNQTPCFLKHMILKYKNQTHCFLNLRSVLLILRGFGPLGSRY